MSSSSSASSRMTHRSQITGVPSRCWCGRNLKIFCSQTVENPFRRFYRCEVAIQRKNEDHLFKWIDEALLDETRVVEKKLMGVVDEVNVLKKEMVNIVTCQNKLLAKMEEEMKKKIYEEMQVKLNEEVMVATSIIEDMARDVHKKSIVRVGIIVLVVGVIGLLCAKYL